MRTTLDIADDVLLATKELARRERSSMGAVISRLARQGLIAGGTEPSSPGPVPSPSTERLARLGIRTLSHRGSIVTNAVIDRIRDEEGI